MAVARPQPRSSAGAGVECGARADDRLQVPSPDRQRQPCRIGRVEELPAREPPAVGGHAQLTNSLKLRRLLEDLGCGIASTAASSFLNQARVCGSRKLCSLVSGQDMADELSSSFPGVQVRVRSEGPQRMDPDRGSLAAQPERQGHMRDWHNDPPPAPADAQGKGIAIW